MGTVNLPITSRSSAHDQLFSDVYANDLALVTEINGNLDASNLASNAVGTSELADGSVTAAKLSGIGADAQAGYAAVATEQSIQGEEEEEAEWQNLSTSGPSVTITVPSNGLVAVYAEVAVKVDDGDAYVGLYEATDISTTQQILSTSSSSYTTLRTTPNDDDGTSTRTRAAELVFPATAGSRTYTLKYKAVIEDRGESASFKARKLFVTVYDPS
jgi:hypothetical protein